MDGTLPEDTKTEVGEVGEAEMGRMSEVFMSWCWDL